MKFISKEEWKALSKQTDEILINEVLSRVFNRAVETAILKLPDTISRLMVSTTATQNMTKDFFKRNSSFEEHKDIVASVTQDVESLHPEWNYEEILKEAEGVIKFKIEVLPKQGSLPLDKPEKVNLDGNGIL